MSVVLVRWAGCDEDIDREAALGTEYLAPVEADPTNGADFWDELSLWAAPFGRTLLDRVPIQAGLTIVDVAAGTGFTTIELAQRCGSSSRVIAVDP